MIPFLLSVGFAQVAQANGEFLAVFFDKDSIPLANVSVELIPEKGRPIQLSSDANGVCGKSLEPGSWTLKVNSAKDSVEEINPLVNVNEISTKLDEAALTSLIRDIDVVVDGTDNFKTRLMVNDASVNTRTALVSGAAIKLEGQIMAYDPTLEDGPCYRCLYGDASDGDFNCAENGVLATVVGVVGTIMATEAIKMITGIGKNLAGFLLVFDAASMEFRKLRLPRNPDCSACGLARTDRGL